MMRFNNQLCQYYRLQTAVLILLAKQQKGHFQVVILHDYWSKTQLLECVILRHLKELQKTQGKASSVVSICVFQSTAATAVSATIVSAKS